MGWGDTDLSRRTEETERTVRIFGEEKKLLSEAVDFLRSRGVDSPDTVLTLGSGLSMYSDMLENSVAIPYSDIPGFAASTAPGHAGMLFAGERFGRKVIVFSGRWHPYEGYTQETVVFFIRVSALLGAKRYIVTNASGAINTGFRTPGLMLVADHINMSGENPLIGPNYDELGIRFPDMSDLYNRSLREAVRKEASAAGIPLSEGVYAMMKGPSLETPAEIRFLRTIGADAVGMSSVPEAIAAKHAGMEVIGISCLANPAAGIATREITSEEIFESADAVADDFIRLVDIAIRI